MRNAIFGFFMALVLPMISSNAFALTYTVTNTNDAGTGSLREMMQFADGAGSPGKDTIVFNIPGPLWQINLATALPVINQSIVIDGTTQPGYNPSSGQIVTVLGNGRTFNCIESTGEQNEIYGLFLTGFLRAISFTNSTGSNIIGSNGKGNVISDNQQAIYIDGNGGSRIQDNFIGVSFNGLSELGNAEGIAMENASAAATIRGNVISGNSVIGMRFSNSSFHTVDSNIVGLGVDGQAAVPNEVGVLVEGTSQNISFTANTVSGNNTFGLLFVGTTSFIQLRSNKIGVAADGFTARPNNDGLVISVSSTNHTIGGLDPRSQNIIAYNENDGIRIEGNTTPNSFSYNSIFSNGRGIRDIRSLRPSEPQVNDFTAPILTGSGVSGSIVVIYADSNSQGQFILDTVFTDATGQWRFDTTGSAIRSGMGSLIASQIVNNNSSGFSLPQSIQSCLEPLIVTSNADDSICGTLRFAIGYANTNPGTDTIAFSISNDTILVASKYTLQGDSKTFIDGADQSIVLRPNGRGNIDGEMISIESRNAEIRNLELYGFQTENNNREQVAITIQSSADSAFLSNLEIHGFDDAAIFSEAENVLLDSLVLYDNNEVALVASGSNTNLTNSLIGIDRSKDAIGIQEFGIAFLGFNALISDNIIAGNDSIGIALFGGNISLVSNYIGVDSDGSTIISNGSHGISTYSGAESIFIGDSATDEFNVIAGNQGNGIFFDLEGTPPVIAHGNLIFSNSLKGIQQDFTIPVPSLNSVANGEVSGTGVAGAYLQLYGTNDNQGELFLGSMFVAADGTFNYPLTTQNINDLQNQGLDSLTAIQDVNGRTSEFSAPIFLDLCANPLLVTHTRDEMTCGSFRNAAEYANSNNGPDTILFSISNDTIFLESELRFFGDSNTVIDGGQQNVVIGKAPSSILFSLIEANQKNTVIKNLKLYGTASDNTKASHGLYLPGSDGFITASNLTIHGCVNGVLALNNNLVFDSLVIYDNVEYGLNLPASAPVIVSNSLIGVDENKNPTGSQNFGLILSGAPSATEFHTLQNNVIAGNDSIGVIVFRSNVRFTNNFIGVDTDGSTIIGNDGPGIMTTTNASSVFVGDSATGEFNVIAGNTGPGIMIGSGGSAPIVAHGNLIFANEKGIDVDASQFPSVVPPTLDSVFNNVVLGTGVGNAFLQFYATNNDQGELYLGSVNIDADGTFSYPFTLGNIEDIANQGLDSLTAVQDVNGITSEFSSPILLEITPTCPQPFEVVSVGDSNRCGTLRYALNEAASSTESDTITFNIPGTGPWVITLDSILPEVARETVIDGTSQPGWDRINGLMVTLDGQDQSFHGLDAGGGDVEIYGLTIQNFISGIRFFFDGGGHQVGDTNRANVIHSNRNGVQILLDDFVVIRGNFIGTNVTGTQPLPNQVGVNLETNSGGHIVEYNVISGNSSHGIRSNTGGAQTVRYNHIGVAANGNDTIPNGGSGIFFSTNRNHQIHHNVISGNRANGIFFSRANYSRIYANRIGITLDGSPAPNNIGILFGNASTGINGFDTVGGYLPEDENIIAYNTNEAIEVRNGTYDKVTFLRNQIYCNGAAITFVDGVNDFINPPVVIDIIDQDEVVGTADTNDLIWVYLADAQCNGDQGIQFLDTTRAINGTDWSISGLSLSPGQKVVAYAEDTAGNSSVYANINIEAPDGFYAAAGSDEISTIWNQHDDTRLDYYTVLLGTDPSNLNSVDSTNSISDTSLVLPNLTVGTTYYVAVVGVTPGGVRSDTSIVEVVTTVVEAGNAIQLTLDSAYVDLTACLPQIEGLDQGTISGWFKSENTDTTAGTIFSIGQSASSFLQVGIGDVLPSIDEESFYFLLSRNSATVPNVLGMYTTGGSDLYNDGQWHHFAVITGDGNNRILIDGLPQVVTFQRGGTTTNEFSDVFREGENMRIGAVDLGAGNSVQFVGELDEIAIWDTALTNSQVLSLRDHNILPADLAGSGAIDPISLYHFDETSTNTIYNGAPNGCDGIGVANNIAVVPSRAMHPYAADMVDTSFVTFDSIGVIWSSNTAIDMLGHIVYRYDGVDADSIGFVSYPDTNYTDVDPLSFDSWYLVAGVDSAGQVGPLSLDSAFVPVGCNPLIVTNTEDTIGCGTLRSAIAFANTRPGVDSVVFQLTATGPYIIQLVDSGLVVTDPIILDGYNQDFTSQNTASSGFDATLQIIIDGQNAGTTLYGLELRSDSNKVSGIEFVNFDEQDGAGLALIQSNHNTITGNVFGEGDGSSAGNFDGLYLFESKYNQIGDTSVADRNIMVNNTYSGVFLASSDSNNIVNNYIGISEDPTFTYGNGVDGMSIEDGSSFNLIQNNVIVNNDSAGIYIAADCHHQTILGNVVGLNFEEQLIMGNATYGGLAIWGDHNFVGNGTLEGANVLAGNSNAEVYIAGSNNTLDYNFIGVAKDSAWIDHGLDGVLFLENADSNVLLSNVIAYTDRAISVTSNSNKNRFVANSIFSNQAAFDFINTAQENIVPPMIDSLNRIEGSSSALLSGNASPNALIQLYVDSTNQGKVFLDSLRADASGAWSTLLDTNQLANFRANDLGFITALQDSVGNTSSFSIPFAAIPTTSISIPLDSITGLTVTIGDSIATLNWTGSTNVTQTYYIHYSTDSVNFTVVDTIFNDSTSTINITNGTSQYVFVSVTNGTDTDSSNVIALEYITDLNVFSNYFCSNEELEVDFRAVGFESIFTFFSVEISDEFGDFSYATSFNDSEVDLSAFNTGDGYRLRVFSDNPSVYSAISDSFTIEEFIPIEVIDDFDTVFVGQTVGIDVLANDDYLFSNIFSVSQPNTGSAEISGDSIDYRTASATSGLDQFSYTVLGSCGILDTGIVTVLNLFRDVVDTNLTTTTNVEVVIDTSTLVQVDSFRIVYGPVSNITLAVDTQSVTFTADYTSSTFTGTDSIVYRICDNLGCIEGLVTIEVAEPPLVNQSFDPNLRLVVYNQVSPNGDGVYDYFQIAFFDENDNQVVFDDRRIGLRIYTKWGDEIYIEDDYNTFEEEQRWFGQRNVGAKSGQVPDGTYYYVLEVEDEDEPKGYWTRTGFVLLKRAD